MAQTCNVMVINHPHVGEVAKQGNLLALNGLRSAEMAALASGSVDLSLASCEIEVRQWALAIDTATPVACLRPDLLDHAPTVRSEVLDLSRAGRVGFALILINALITFFGMARNMGYAICRTARPLGERRPSAACAGPPA